MEELGVRGVAGGFVGECQFCYAFGTINLKLYRFEWRSGEISLSVHDRMAWVSPEALPDVDFAPADVPLAERLRALMLDEPG